MALFANALQEDPESRVIRLGVFDWLRQTSPIISNEFTRTELEQGATVNGQRIILVGLTFPLKSTAT